ncbi:MAG: M4 family metallopeptidase [Anaerolineales bacterium]|nr:M4 family metallopeptidase [Anaerolineales bacterium]
MTIPQARFILTAILIMVAMIFLAPTPSTASATTPQPEEIMAYHPLTGKVRFIGVQSGTPNAQTAALRSNITSENAALSFLQIRGREFGLGDPANDLQILRKTQADNGANTVRFQQTYHGIPIMAGEMIVHMDSAKNVLSASGDILPNIELDTTPTVSEADAIQTALVKTALENGVQISELQVSAPELWIYSPVLLTPYDGDTVLVWRIEVTPQNALVPIRQLVLVDAKLGGIVLSLNQNAEIMNRLTYDAGGTAAIPGTLACDESNPTCTGGTPDAIKAHEYAGDVYDFYMTNHGRDSIDGAGMSIISTTNSSIFPTARWNGSQMIYAAGWAADDVVAHELTHGVTDYTSDVFLLWQAGAINESFSDIWGEFVDLTNGSGTDTPAVRWKIAEDAPGGALRDMMNPTLYSQPDKMTSPFYYTGASEQNGVHINMSVNNKAVALMVDGGTFNGQTITGLGITKVAKIYYYVQTNLLTSGADYADLYYALQASCAAQIDTAGITAADCQEVLDAVNAVEMNLQPLLPAGGYNPDVSACDVAGEFPLNSFYDDMESGTANWISSSTIGANHWTYDWSYESTLGIFAHSGQHFLFADILPVQVTDTTIQMANSVTIPANGRMIFHHSYATSAGGVLEYSTTNGSSWIDAGSLMDGNGYDMTLSNATNPLNGRQVFIGISHGYISTRLNLSSLAGQNVMFRFRFGMGSSNSGGYGWWLDDVQIYECIPSVHFGVIGDYGQTGQPEADVAALVNSWNPDFVITTGDNNYMLGQAATIDENIGQYYHPYIYPYTGSYGAGSSTNNFYPILGNHDWLTTIGQLPKPYLDYFSLPGNERYYDFIRGPVHFFAVDSDINEPDGITSNSIQGQWLQSALSASTSPWNVVYLHHSPYSSGLHGSNTTLQWPFQAWGADIVLSGHDHTYERLSINGFPYIVNGVGGMQTLYGFNTPVTGSQIRYNADYGAILVDATDTYAIFKFITRSGTVIDTFSLGTPPIDPANKLDLIITNVTVNPTSPASNQTFEVNITIRNQGGTGGANDIYRDVYIDRDPATLINPATGCPPPGDFYISNYYPIIPAGMTDTKTVSITGGLPLGNHQLWFYVDARCLIDESGGSNNAP